MYKVGDKVKVINDDTNDLGREGVIFSIGDIVENYISIKCNEDNGSTCNIFIHKDCLELIENFTKEKSKSIITYEKIWNELKQSLRESAYHYDKISYESLLRRIEGLEELLKIGGDYMNINMNKVFELLESIGFEIEIDYLYDEESIEHTRIISPEGREYTIYGHGNECNIDELIQELKEE